MYDSTVIQPVRPRRAGRAALMVVGVVAGLCCVAGATAAVLGGVLGGAGDTEGGQAVAGDVVAPSRPGLNQAVRDGTFEFVVKAVRCGQSTLDNGWLHVEAKGQFCVAELMVTNIGDEARHFGGGLQHAVGPDGVRYAADAGAGVVANGNGEAVWEVINPGISIDTKVVYDIPVGATIATVELHDSALSGGVTVRVS